MGLRFNVLWSVAQIPLRSLKRILDHSKVRFTKNGLPKFFNVRSREPGQPPVPKCSLLTLDGFRGYPADFVYGHGCSLEAEESLAGNYVDV